MSIDTRPVNDSRDVCLTPKHYWREGAKGYFDKKLGLQMAAGPFVLTKIENRWHIINMEDENAEAPSFANPCTGHAQMLKMAEDWKSGELGFVKKPMSLVYFIQPDRLAAPIKIGVTKNLKARLSGLQTGSSTPLKVLATTPGDEMLEAKYHTKFAAFRVKGEWFYPAPEIIREVLKLNKKPRPTGRQPDEPLTQGIGGARG